MLAPKDSPADSITGADGAGPQTDAYASDYMPIYSSGLPGVPSAASRIDTTGAQVIQTDEGTVIIPPTGLGTYGDPLYIPHNPSSASGGSSTPAEQAGNLGLTILAIPPTPSSTPISPPAPPTYSVPIRVIPSEGRIPSLGTSGGRILGPGPVWE